MADKFKVGERLEFIGDEPGYFGSVAMILEHSVVINHYQEYNTDIATMLEFIEQRVYPDSDLEGRTMPYIRRWV